MSETPAWWWSSRHWLLVDARTFESFTFLSLMFRQMKSIRKFHIALFTFVGLYTIVDIHVSVEMGFRIELFGTQQALISLGLLMHSGLVLISSSATGVSASAMSTSKIGSFAHMFVNNQVVFIFKCTFTMNASQGASLLNWSGRMTSWESRCMCIVCVKLSAGIVGMIALVSNVRILMYVTFGYKRIFNFQQVRQIALERQYI